jgi:2'-hydroxyisoflavone reductase
MQRRDVLKGAAGLAASLALARGFAAETPATPLRILVLGGTRFVGPHFIELAQARGHQVSMFNRGRTNVGRVKNVEVLQGDRDGKLEALQGRQWDAVLDTSGYVPRIVKMSGDLLAPHTSHYVFISSISVYASFAKANDESSPLATIADPTVEKVTGETYGALKALSEQAAEKSMPGRTTVLRPGLIVGPEDNTDRFTYWPARVDRGGEVLAPNAPGDRIQVVDVRDLCAFILAVIEKRTLGTFNVISPPGRFTMGALLDACLQAAKSGATPTWVPTGFLQEHKVAPWSDMPVWIPETGEEAGTSLTSVERAIAAGLTIRPLPDTVRDTLAWHRSRPEEQKAKLKAGIEPGREKEVLAAWHAVRKSQGSA